LLLCIAPLPHICNQTSAGPIDIGGGVSLSQQRGRCCWSVLLGSARPHAGKEYGKELWRRSSNSC